MTVGVPFSDSSVTVSPVSDSSENGGAGWPGSSSGETPCRAVAAGRYSSSRPMKRPQHVDPPNPPLSDGAVTLRPMRESDLPRLLEEGNDPDTRRWVNVPVPYAERDARDELHGWIASWDDPARPLALTITDADEDA